MATLVFLVYQAIDKKYQKADEDQQQNPNKQVYSCFYKT